MYLFHHSNHSQDQGYRSGFWRMVDLPGKEKQNQWMDEEIKKFSHFVMFAACENEQI